MIAQVTADGCAWSQDKQNSPGMSSANRTQAKVGAYSSICEEEPHILLKIPFNYCWGLIMLLTTWLRWVWWYKEMELYPSMHFSCVLLNDRCIKTHSTESALALNARNVIVKLNSCGSSKVFRPSRHHGCERKQYAGGGLSKDWVSLANLQDYWCPHLRVLKAEGCQQLYLMGKGNNEFPITDRHYSLDLIFTDIGKEFS